MKQVQYPHSIQVDDEIHDLLHRTAASRDTDINGVLHYLLETPANPPADTADNPDDEQ